MSWTARVLVTATLLSAAAAAASPNCTSPQPGHLLVKLSKWREDYLSEAASQAGTGSVRRNTVLAWILSFLAASVSSAGGVGGGSLFLPILNLVAGLSLKRATSYSSFMVTGGAVSNVLYNLFCTRGLIDYDIALLFQPCLLLGVSLGVVCNVMFPEWLITALFSLFLAFCTTKTWRAGVKIWRTETVAARQDHKVPLLIGGGLPVAGQVGGEGSLGGGSVNGGSTAGDRPRFPLKDIAVLLVVWLSFFLLHVFIGDKHGKGVIKIKPCGIAYWLVTIFQVPFAVAFTAYIVYAKRNKQGRHDDEDGKEPNSFVTKTETLPPLALPLAAFVTGSLSGLFGIGGGLLLNPVLLQIGIPPQTAAATSSFMVLFCASMSMVQFILLGMEGIGEAAVYAGICFIASLTGVILIARAVKKSGRVSMIVFLVTAIMALSTVIVTCFGALDVWTQYIGGAYMGFKLPC
ncbi:hypothetical protein QYE76_056035 [Lolium multiflorum]|uniref:Sulfite exporter TauE/SafE family protein n=1 Tax=Lolium multiflorum TaxID=4521 RepID=A0AAD8T0U9_LOLMU|nr:hypothetical protein QYE76_056035 [Lolium multiflorum]